MRRSWRVRPRRRTWRAPSSEQTRAPRHQSSSSRRSGTSRTCNDDDDDNNDDDERSVRCGEDVPTHCSVTTTRTRGGRQQWATRRGRQYTLTAKLDQWLRERSTPCSLMQKNHTWPIQQVKGQVNEDRCTQLQSPLAMATAARVGSGEGSDETYLFEMRATRRYFFALYLFLSWNTRLRSCVVRVMAWFSRGSASTKERGERSNERERVQQGGRRRRGGSSGVSSPLALGIVGLALPTPSELDLVAHVVRPSLDDLDEPLRLTRGRERGREYAERVHTEPASHSEHPENESNISSCSSPLRVCAPHMTRGHRAAHASATEPSAWDT
jgi:hypothetical protein